MAEIATINQSISQFSNVLAESEVGCLVQIYPTDDGPCGLWELDRESLTLGRAKDCDIQLDDDSVSREHAVIRHDLDGYTIKDLGSTNGTWVNDKRVDSAELTAGDRVRCGSQIMKFLSADHIELQYHETVYKMTTTDGLTNAHNKRYMLDVLERSIARARHCHRPVSLIMMDIDFFKQVNDTHGHLAGDEVLQEFSRRVKEVIDDHHVFSRYGGEEFSLIVDEGSVEDSQSLGKRINEVIQSRPFETNVGPVAVTVSLGLAWTDGSEPMEPQDLIARSDEKLYEAKRGGRNRIVW
ncbi:MAG: GGDEF domain-containing protein [Planctomycetales bacterium]|nr:GGDEF domain-containing protein [Planctomycetales bacterium]